jgi:hypothetical protein
LWISACFRWSTCWFFVFIKRNAENVIKSGILAERTWKYTSESVTWSTYTSSPTDLLTPRICYVNYVMKFTTSMLRMTWKSENITS